MFGFGENIKGRLGQNDARLDKPTKLNDFGEFVDANREKTCTTDQNKRIYLNDVKDLWSWDTNGSGQLGHGDTDYRAEIIDALIGKKLREVSANSGCVACVTVDNSCYVWGNCERFGLSPNVSHCNRCSSSKFPGTMTPGDGWSNSLPRIYLWLV